MNEVDKAIAKWREAIDRTDERLLELLNERSRYTAEIGRLKLEQGEPVFVPGRELEILERLEARNPGPFPTSAIRSVFREILSASVALQRGVKVAYLGPPATYTHQAALQQFGQMADFAATSTIDEIFASVESKTAEFGVVPIENSNEGVVSHTLDLFVESPLTICAEIHVAVHHELLARGDDLRTIESVYSHPQALAQCRRWLELNLPRARQHATHSTAQAAEEATRNDGIAAIASPIAAGLYGLNVLCSGIEDSPENTTRFLVIGRKPPRKSDRDITSLLFSIKRDQVGALCQALEPFARHGVNLTRIESRPTRVKAWEYIFFCDFEGHLEDPTVKKAIEELKPRCDFVKVLGSYPRAAAK
ncbi:MAG: prephenate dehydratase [Myxococcota bacterium]